MPGMAYDDVAADFEARFAAVATVPAAWQALLANAELLIARAHTPDAADDYLTFEVRRGLDGHAIVVLERRVAKFEGDSDYAGTRVLCCYVTVAIDPAPEPWTIDGHVTGYDPLDGTDDRPPLPAFRATVEASDPFRRLAAAPVIVTQVTNGWQ